MQESGVLTFGDFTLKSGRTAPYFINAGNYNTGEKITRLGGFYADCIMENKIAAETLFGPAYKGIPLAVSTASALYGKYGVNMNYAFDRKEAKDHGEGGIIVGKRLSDGERVVIIEDVMTSGKALREVMPKLKTEANVDVRAMVIQVDRMEKGLTDGLSAAEEAKRDFGITVYPIVTILDIIAAAEAGLISGREYVPAMREYRSRYGVN